MGGRTRGFAGGVALAGLWLLAACGSPAPEIARDAVIPVAGVFVDPVGETVMRGTLETAADGSHRLAMRSETGSTCSGLFNARGTGRVSCTNGWMLTIRLPHGPEGAANGSVREVSGGIGAVIGWGAKADIAMLRRAL